jgi:hypothetical protein
LVEPLRLALKERRSVMVAVLHCVFTVESPNRCRRRRRPIAVVCALAAALLALPTAASAAEVSGVVVTIDNGELVIDLGSERGAREGMSAELWRPLKLKHPVTGKLLTDRFRIGKLQFGQVRKTLAIAATKDELTREPAVGDIVIIHTLDSEKGAPSPVAPAGPPPAPVAATKSRGDDAEAAEIARILDSLRGADPGARIRRYEDYVRANPHGRFARVLYEEAAALRRLYERAAPAATPQGPTPQVVSYHHPDEAVSGQPLRLAVELSDAASGAVLHTRRPGQLAYSSTPMTAVGHGYFGATVPAEQLVGPQMEYFIEGTDARGAAAPLVGQPDAPQSVRVHEPDKPQVAQERRATVFVLSDFASYNRFEGNDQVWQTEGYFGVRYGDVGIRALRTGFGVYRGVGGTLEDLDKRGYDGRKVGLTYGYLETEIGIVPAFSLIGRGVVGLLDDGVSGGGQMLVRIGKDLETNLSLGGELLGGVGLRSFAQLELNTFPRWPIVLRSEVTNQPAGAAPRDQDVGKPGISQGSGEIGARGIAQLGFRPVRPLMVAVRGSFQGRTIEHAGPGGGLAMGYDW